MGKRDKAIDSKVEGPGLKRRPGPSTIENVDLGISTNRFLEKSDASQTYSVLPKSSLYKQNANPSQFNAILSKFMENNTNGYEKMGVNALENDSSAPFGSVEKECAAE